MSKKIAKLEWARMPIDAGQIVDVSYAVDEDYRYLYCRRHDRADNEVTVTRQRIDAESESEFAPQNNELPDTVGEAETV